jgi:transcriptional regulator with XRE-family HTH domain
MVLVLGGCEPPHKLNYSGVFLFVNSLLKKIKCNLLFFIHHHAIMGAKEVENMKTTTIGARIKARRQELKMTQRDLAARMGYTDHTTITRIESGKTDPPQSRVAQFAQVLGVSPGYLMGWDQEPEELADVAARVLLDPDLLGMVEQYLQLAEADQYAVRLVVSSMAHKNKKADAKSVSQKVKKVSLLETE